MGGVGDVDCAEGVCCWRRGVSVEGRGREIAENPKRQFGVPASRPGWIGVALAITSGPCCGIHATEGCNAASDAKIAPVACAVADDFGGA